ncbi:hypothetical protein NFO65_13480 [Neorhizobium galegae]|uniref:hypothetical protein n=1 Tax=Neorhizobium galegae TaxID=399 RepID=UPI0021015376|nr:hypothetical protein [Neorhizobium galegae]MCQ1571738.1 hypothetical protein [Neorhizobium galegae]
MFISLFGYEVHATFGFDRNPLEPFLWFSKDRPRDWSARLGRLMVYFSAPRLTGPLTA